MNAKIFWFTGLSGSGKSTIANQVKAQLQTEGLSVGIIDGDDVRNSYPTPLGFSRADVLLNNQIITQMCKTKKEMFDIILVPIIAPYQTGRELARDTFSASDFYLVYFSADLQTVSQRDVKGLYAKSRKGEISPMLGTSDDFPYEVPTEFDLEINSTHGAESIAQSTARLLKFIHSKVKLQNHSAELC